MGRQSSRLYFQGKDHKDIYFQGHYHDAMYIGNQLVWEKLGGKLEPMLYEDISVGVPEEYRKNHVLNMVSTVFGSVVFAANVSDIYARNGSGYLFRYNSNGEYAHISGMNTAIRGSNDDVLFPDNGLYQKGTVISNVLRPYDERLKYCFDKLLGTVLDSAGVSPDTGISYFYYTVRGIDMQTGELIRNIPFTIDGVPLPTFRDSGECEIMIGESQYFGGRLYANITESTVAAGWHSTTDGINWVSKDPKLTVSGRETVIGDYLFYESGKAINRNFDEITYSRMPAIYVNDWYYAEELDNGYLMRSKNLQNWERYKDIGVSNNYTVSGYWRTKNLLCLRKAEDDADGEAGIYKYKIHL